MDTELEAAIDRAGRDIVFAVMRAHGWSAGDMPPKWAWWEAVRLVTPPPPPTGD